MAHYPFVRILVPIDFSTGSDSALELAARIAAEHQSELFAVHIVETHGLPLGTFIHPATHPEGITIERYTHDLAMQELSARLQRLPAAVRHRGRVVVGSPTSTIVEIASAESADLIVMGTHGRTGLAHFLVGSVAEKVVRHSPIPVLTVRATEPREALAKAAEGDTEAFANLAEPVLRAPYDAALDDERSG